MYSIWIKISYSTTNEYHLNLFKVYGPEIRRRLSCWPCKIPLGKFSSPEKTSAFLRVLKQNEAEQRRIFSPQHHSSPASDQAKHTTRCLLVGNNRITYNTGR